MQIYIVTDLEGVAGVCLFEQTRPPELIDAEYLRARELLTAEVNAAVAGCLDGGATRVVVNDGHGGGFNILPDQIHPEMELVHGRQRPHIFCGCDESFDAVMLVGYHAMQGTPTGILHHTQSSKTWAGYWVNGKETGEIGQMAILAAGLGLPIVCVTGDQAACDEARAFLGDELVTVPVKEGYSRHACRTYSPQRARAMIREGCRQAMDRIGQVPLYEVEFPATIRVELQSPELADAYGGKRSQRVSPTTFERVVETPAEIISF